MPPSTRRWLSLGFVAAVFILGLYHLTDYDQPSVVVEPIPVTSKNNQFPWKDVPKQYPVSSMMALPTARPLHIPTIQFDFSWRKESKEEKDKREARMKAVRENFAHAWEGYKAHAWMKDEVAPLSGGSRDTFGGWAATLVDSLDTLWIMGFKKEFMNAVGTLDKIDFSRSSGEEINVFETTIRYLGGFLSAYDLSGHASLLAKAIQLGEMLYVAFDTPNRMPNTRWRWKDAADGKSQEAAAYTIVAEIGSLSLEFTRLSQLSGDPKYFDAVQRITEQFLRYQNQTRLPGMWPVIVTPENADFVSDNTFSLGAMSDSLYEYLPKQYMLLGGLHDEYREMYEAAIVTAKQHNLFQPLNKDNLDILVSGLVKVYEGKAELVPEGQHLVCFAGGMIGIASQIFGLDDLSTARKLVDGCIWAYESMPAKIMPETFRLIPCKGDCLWSEAEWYKEVLSYQTGPEAIESVFILYRITGDTTLQDKAWNMFQAIEKHTRTDIAHASLIDVTLSVPAKSDRMESFWTAETLKYFFLIFSEPNVISLDEYIL
ncbi:phosphatidylinositol-3,5-bisphosphate 5-phosphatase [Xylographa pallens]|nr:phosphatidylinositol-3,5-bisphosphate 5-phosphatase [Xylographa pallens]